MAKAAARHFPAPRVLYTDVCGGQILGYTEDDMRAALCMARPRPDLKLTRRQAAVVDAMLKHGTQKGAARALAIQENSVKKALQLARKKAGGVSTLQLCVAWVTGGADSGLPLAVPLNAQFTGPTRPRGR